MVHVLQPGRQHLSSTVSGPVATGTTSLRSPCQSRLRDLEGEAERRSVRGREVRRAVVPPVLEPEHRLPAVRREEAQSPRPRLKSRHGAVVSHDAGWLPVRIARHDHGLPVAPLEQLVVRGTVAYVANDFLWYFSTHLPYIVEENWLGHQPEYGRGCFAMAYSGSFLKGYFGGRWLFDDAQLSSVSRFEKSLVQCAFWLEDIGMSSFVDCFKTS